MNLERETFAVDVDSIAAIEPGRDGAIIRLKDGTRYFSRDAMSAVLGELARIEAAKTSEGGATGWRPASEAR